MVSTRQTETAESNHLPTRPHRARHGLLSFAIDAQGMSASRPFARRTQKILSSLLAFGVPAFGVTACDSCNRERPYVPFHADSSLSAASTIESSTPTPSAAVAPIEPEIVIEAKRIEPASSRLEVAGKGIELPKKLRAEWSLEHDLTGDGQLDALVWVRSEARSPSDAEPLASLWFFPTGGDARQVWTLPGFMPTGQGCTLQPHLQGLASGFAWLDVTSHCTGSLPERTPTRLAILLAPAASRPIVLGLRVAEPAEGESLAFTPKLVDRDGDKRLDPTLSFEMTVARTSATAKAEFGWIDRTAGLSFDESYFTTALEPTFLSWEAKLSKKTKAVGLNRETDAFRRLLASLCQQAATPRIWDYQGDAFRCPAVSTIGSRLTRIEVKTALVTNDLALALHSLSYASQWMTGLAAVERETMRKLIDKQFTLVKATLPLPVTVRPKPSNGQPRFSPLKFDVDGSLLVVNDKNGLERVALDGSSTVLSPVVNSDSDAGTSELNHNAPKPWPLEVVARDGRKWAGVVPACNRSELVLSFTLPNGSLAPLTPTQLLAPRPGVCKAPKTWPLNIAPIAFTGELPTAIIDGACVAEQGATLCQNPSKLGPTLPGSPRSPDGRRLVVASVLGPVVFGGNRPERWENAAFEGAPLSDCVVSNDASAIACIQQGKVLFSLRPVTSP
jgi:hypothetical protein